MKKNNKKGFTLVEIMIVVVIIGLLAAMAVPAFQQVRKNSREKAMVNNLRQIASAGQQYLLESGESSVGYEALVDLSYFNDFQPVAGEDYSGVTVTEDGGDLSVGDADNGASFSY